jgi:serine acetyltransferase
MIEIGAGITIGPGIVIGNRRAIVVITDFITEDSNFLISETGENFIEEN